MDDSADRRTFLGLIPGAALLGVATSAGAAEPTPAAKPAPSGAPGSQPADVNATEDLMREHGILRRLLILMELWIPNRSGLDLPRPPAEPLKAALHLVDTFVHGYHEKLEEQQVFPVMQKKGLQVGVVKVLLEQHEAGRRVTSGLQGLLASSKPDWAAVGTQLDRFARMYQPHAAREDTEVFPAFHALFTEKEFDELSDKFEELEHQLLRGGSFETTLAEVQQLEKALGVNDLGLFTPRG